MLLNKNLVLERKKSWGAVKLLFTAPELFQRHYSWNHFQ